MGTFAAMIKTKLAVRVLESKSNVSIILGNFTLCSSDIEMVGNPAGDNRVIDSMPL